MAKKEMQQSIGLEARYERYKGKIKEMTLMSDIFMRNVFKKKKCLEYVLQVIMEVPELHIMEHVIQKDYKNLQGHSAILDCVAIDMKSRLYDVEVQQGSDGASPKRARYYGGLLDMNILDSGQEYEKLPESYVIFITAKDVLGYGLPIYHVRKSIEEVDESFPDEAHIIYVNTSIQEDTDLGRLAHDLHCKNAEDMYREVLAERVRELKETREGVESMCREMEEFYNEAIEVGEQRGIEIGRKDTQKETAISLSEMGLPIEKIAQAIKSSVDEIQKWLEESVSAAR